MMRRISWFAVAMVGLLAVVAWGQEERRSTEKNTTADSNRSDDSVQKILDRVGKLPPAAQQDWLLRLEHRAMRATQRGLSAEEAAKQQAKIRTQLHRGLVTWPTLREVIETVDAREKDVISQRVQRYRDMVFDAFHSRQNAMAEHQQAWSDVYRAWKAAGSQFEQQERLIEWLDKAIRNLASDVMGPLPETPKFEPDQMAETSSPATAPQNKAEPGKMGRSDVQRTIPQGDKKTPSTAQSSRSPNGPSTDRTLMAGGEVAIGSIEIQVDELSARVSGFNLSLRGLESDLDEKGVWNAERLDVVLDQLNLLAVRRNDLQLFRDALPKKQRASVEKIESLDSAIASVNARIADVRKYLNSQEFNGSDEERQDELDRLDAVSQRLAKISGKRRG